MKYVFASDLFDQLTVTQFVNPGSISVAGGRFPTGYLRFVFAAVIFWWQRPAAVAELRQELFLRKGVLAQFRYRGRRG
ncbi:MAG: hypothetical protein CMJ75_01800 [Planctomycetaceae bacterium]|nr:hypothetical protein [Planctomycetaceae bacterium]